MSDKIYVGIDIGKKGGLCSLHKGKLKYIAMPMQKNNDVDRRKLASVITTLLKKGKVHLIFEKLHGRPNQKASVTFSLGGQVEIVKTIADLYKIPHTEVTPQTWQKAMFMGVTKIYKKSKKNGVVTETTDTKKMALTAIKKIFPDYTFLATEKSKVPHDGIVDAALLAEYGRRKNL